MNTVAEWVRQQTRQAAERAVTEAYTQALRAKRAQTVLSNGLPRDLPLSPLAEAVLRARLLALTEGDDAGSE